MEIYGASAGVFLDSSNSLNELAQKISKALILPEFDFETKEDYPHEQYASNEALGFQIWLESSNTLAKYNYLIKLETEMSFEEIFDDKMYDLSGWLARYLSKMCSLKACILDRDSNQYIEFSDGLSG